MKELFKDILALKDIKGILFFSLEGQLIFKELSSSASADVEKGEWQAFIDAMNGVQEADLVYEYDRIYLRKTGIGYLLILMTGSAQVAMVRLNCDILIPSLKDKRFYRKFAMAKKKGFSL